MGKYRFKVWSRSRNPFMSEERLESYFKTSAEAHDYVCREEQKSIDRKERVKLYRVEETKNA